MIMFQHPPDKLNTDFNPVASGTNQNELASVKLFPVARIQLF